MSLSLVHVAKGTLYLRMTRSLCMISDKVMKEQRMADSARQRCPQRNANQRARNDFLDSKCIENERVCGIVGLHQVTVEIDI
jgi:hypothetical protein